MSSSCGDMLAVARARRREGCGYRRLCATASRTRAPWHRPSAFAPPSDVAPRGVPACGDCLSAKDKYVRVSAEVELLWGSHGAASRSRSTEAYRFWAVPPIGAGQIAALTRNPAQAAHPLSIARPVNKFHHDRFDQARGPAVPGAMRGKLAGPKPVRLICGTIRQDHAGRLGTR
jgi:hypothetical protein